MNLNHFVENFSYYIHNLTFRLTQIVAAKTLGLKRAILFTGNQQLLAIKNIYFRKLLPMYCRNCVRMYDLEKIIMDLQVNAITKVLKDISQMSNIYGAALFSNHGILITSHLPNSIDKRQFCAMCATMAGAALTAGISIGNHNVEQLTVRFDEHYLLCEICTEEILLVIVIDKHEEMNMSILTPFISEIKKLSNNI
ncbi:hypothetical protein NEF87_000824 [Candidatus Lokiarchaeum ossiferum]|uniref:Roadblock/LAMTOR2 domain-containing protein n=1 Tax=Candidatus Lokiarchaeum ossiferum TaxID=2951803 RepID=A0ABY6HPP8_9ARCH|nr:hypothetical protein NEF87_000824 [Candidatus Lokiarchaeum sp. B-35]